MRLSGLCKLVASYILQMCVNISTRKYYICKDRPTFKHAVICKYVCMDIQYTQLHGLLQNTASLYKNG